MKNTPQKIVDQIKSLLDELVSATEGKTNLKNVVKRQSNSIIPKGASGALKILTNDGFFDTPQDISKIMEKLKEIGRYYPKTSISMNLLNLTKRREFNRIKDKETKNWLYVLRK
ncbi:MAG: hypothetical protein WC657_02435 [Candidatus Paceibacterota bacterium]|jgi:hypothetical protein